IYRDWFDIPDSRSAYELMKRVGLATTNWLSSNASAVPRLSQFYRGLLDQPLRTRVELEAIESPKARKFGEGEQLFDQEFLGELQHAAASELASLDDQAAAAVALHLLLDGKLYLDTQTESKPPVVTPPPPAPHSPARTEAPRVEGPLIH